MAPNGCLFPVLVAVVFFAMAAGVPRSKRASDGDDAEPKIITQSGHLIFQTGANHNISFRTEGTGKVVVGNEDLLQVVAQVSADTESNHDRKCVH
ncbi:cubilin-like [Saccoglossus kowalevskii]